MAISWNSAYHIRISDYWASPDFKNVCLVARQNNFCQSELFFGNVMIDGIQYAVPPAGLVKMADKANACQKQQEMLVPTIQFILPFYTQFVPFDSVAQASFQLMLFYNQQNAVRKIDEKEAAAAIFMILFGYELQKLQLLRKQVWLHKEHVANMPATEHTINRRLATISEYLCYHIDLVDEQEGTIIRGYQFEHSEKYFQYLNFSKELPAKAPMYQKKWIDANRRQSNRFIDDFQKELIQAVYKIGCGKSRIYVNGMYAKVRDLGL